MNIFQIALSEITLYDDAFTMDTQSSYAGAQIRVKVTGMQVHIRENDKKLQKIVFAGVKLRKDGAESIAWDDTVFAHETRLGEILEQIPQHIRNTVGF